MLMPIEFMPMKIWNEPLSFGVCVCVVCGSGFCYIQEAPRKKGWEIRPLIQR